MSEIEGKRKTLGRGLNALLGERPAAAVAGEAKTSRLPVEKMRPGKFQPRRAFDEERIADLVESVREKGILQPILVRRHPDDAELFEIIAGERRWRAAQAAQLHEVPVIVRELSDQEALEVALVENLQRQDLSPLEEADGYRRLMDEFTHTQEDLAKAVGKSRSHVANMMRLLALPDAVKAMLDKGELSAGHARALLTAEDPVSLARQVAAKGLNVRQTEKLAQAPRAAKVKAKPGHQPDADTVALERDLTNLLGVRVSIRFAGKGGELIIHYGNLEQLDDILHRLSHGPARKAEDDG
jgi:ParB family chromosome partitioning protein